MHNKKINIYLIGGPVRDLIIKKVLDPKKHNLGSKIKFKQSIFENQKTFSKFINFLSPNIKDIDILIDNGNAITFAQKVHKTIGGKLTVFKSFKTAKIMIDKHLEIDFSTSRNESYKKPGALPKVFKGSFTEDLKRRDFTINTFALSLNKSNFGNIIDLFHGYKDLKNKKIRVLHDLSFIDDPTRLHRAIKFMVRFNLKMESNTKDLFDTANKFKVYETISPFRLKRELKSLLSEKNIAKILKYMSTYKLLNHIHPKIKLTENKIKIAKSIEKILAKSKILNIDMNLIDIWILYISVLCVNLTKNDLNIIILRLSLSKKETIILRNFQSISKKLITELKHSNIQPSKIKELLNIHKELLIFTMALDKKTVTNKIVHFLKYQIHIRTGITGHDICKLGITPGKQVKHILNDVYDYKVLNKSITHKEEIQYIIDNYLKK